MIRRNYRQPSSHSVDWAAPSVKWRWWCVRNMWAAAWNGKWLPIQSNDGRGSGEWEAKPNYLLKTCCFFPELKSILPNHLPFRRMGVKTCACSIFRKPSYVGHLGLLYPFTLRLYIPFYSEYNAHTYFERLSLNLEHQIYCCHSSFIA